MRSTHPAADITSTVTDVDNQLTLTEAVDSCQRIMAQLSDSEDQLRLLSDLFVSYLQDLPFYYHTSSHTRFYEGPMPDFNEQRSTDKRKCRRVPRREQPAAFAPRRATMTVRGTLSVRAEFHNKPIELPPIPNEHVHVFDHSYAQQ